jgi:DNA-directed RNA polymerase subunit RPC12/RpoP
MTYETTTGYVCASCGAWVPSSVGSHNCGSTSITTQPPIAYVWQREPPAPDGFIAAFNRLEEKLKELDAKIGRLEARLDDAARPTTERGE